MQIEVMITKQIFKMLAKMNKVIMPRFSKKDITRLSKIEKGLIAWRYWVTLNSLD